MKRTLLEIPTYTFFQSYNIKSFSENYTPTLLFGTCLKFGTLELSGFFYLGPRPSSLEIVSLVLQLVPKSVWYHIPMTGRMVVSKYYLTYYLQLHSTHQDNSLRGIDNKTVK